MSRYVGAIDQGTTSSRFILFDKDGTIAHIDQREHEQINPKAGWVEHDAKEVWRRTREVIGGEPGHVGLGGVGVARVRDAKQGEPAGAGERGKGDAAHHAAVWQETRPRPPRR